MESLPTKTLLIAVVEKEDTILMRKKPAGSPPYEETWYIFGCERIATQEDSVTIIKYLQTNFDIIVDSVELIGKDMEDKKDHDNVLKAFTYIDFKCKYKEGTVSKPDGIEKIEWIPKSNLSEYDIVPPSQKLFKKLGYL